MDFSIFFSSQRIHEPKDYSRTLLDEKRDEAVLADKLGYKRIWVPEHHLIHFMQTPNALMFAQHVGHGLDIRVGTMAILLTTRHPLISAAEIAMADNSLGGRLDVGVGRGAYEYEFERLGVPYSENKERFAEALEVLEQIWADPNYNVTHHGKYYDIDNAAVWPHPVQTPHPPFWMTAMTSPTIEWAAERGYNVSNWPFIRPMSAVEETAATFHRGRAKRADGGVDQQLTILRGVAPSYDEAAIEKRVDEALINHRINQRLHYFTQTADPRGYVAPEPLEKEPSRAEVRENLIFGTPEECLRKVQAYADLGVTELMLMFDFGPTHEEVMEGMELFAKEVMAPFNATVGAAA
ncbi:LLM class flavin-dependent oxidoreductase [Microbacterium atlanticum]|uniref:LLM class flavin-dependent oxidoreductase n=1 Tax=Microbacterium atlanticum TaxID=2782168 RepID=UPI00188745A1|nr:LLM class flavin-dependent oxidoreductase [Microbacterium atlanticum]